MLLSISMMVMKRTCFLSIKQMQNQSDLQLVIDEREHLDTIKNLTEGFDLVNSHYWEILNIENQDLFLKQYHND